MSHPDIVSCWRCHMVRHKRRCVEIRLGGFGTTGTPAWCCKTCNDRLEAAMVDPVEVLREMVPGGTTPLRDPWTYESLVKASGEVPDTIQVFESWPPNIVLWEAPKDD